MSLREALNLVVALSAGFLAVVWWRSQDLKDNPRLRRWRVPAAIFFAVIALGNLALFVAGRAR